MSDAHLREAERRALSGDLHDAVELLQKRLRTLSRIPCARCKGHGFTGKQAAGDAGILESALDDGLSADTAIKAQFIHLHCPDCDGTGAWPLDRRLELAAFCGHEAAGVLIGPPQEPKPISEVGRKKHRRQVSYYRAVAHTRYVPFQLWVSFLPNESTVVAAAAAARSYLPVWEASFHFVWDGEALIYANSTEGARAEDMGAEHRYYPRRALDACEAHIAHPCRETMQIWAEATSTANWNGRFDWLPHGDMRATMRAVAIETSEAVVRTAISAKLISWSLGL